MLDDCSIVHKERYLTRLDRLAISMTNFLNLVCGPESRQYLKELSPPFSGIVFGDSDESTVKEILYIALRTALNVDANQP